MKRGRCERPQAPPTRLDLLRRAVRPLDAPTAEPEIALLPFVKVSEQIARHPLVCGLHADVRGVYTCLLKLLPLVDQRVPGPPPLAPAERRGERSTCCRAAVAPDGDGAGVVCGSCGAFQFANIVATNPYRVFEEDRGDPSRSRVHWVSYEQDCFEHERWDEAEQYLPFCFGGRGGHSADLEFVRALLDRYKGRYPSVPNRELAVVATMLIAENPSLGKGDNCVVAPPPTPAPIARCRVCGEGFHMARECRVHEARCRAR